MMRDLHLIPAYLAKMWGDVPVLKWGAALLAVSCEYLFGTVIVRNMAFAAFGLMFLDTITGFVAATSTGHPITSAKLSRILVKVVAYGASIIVVAVVTQHVPGINAAHHAVVTIVLTWIMLTEAVSILENVVKMGFTKLGWLTRMLEGKLRQLESDPFDDRTPPRREDAEGYRPLG